MLEIDLSNIPPEGRDIDEALDAVSLGVEAGSDFRLDDGGRVSCHVTRGNDGLVQVTGSLAARLQLTCGRCLEPFAFDLREALDLVYVPRSIGDGATDEDEVSLSDHDMVIAFYDGEQLDLAEIVREQLVLSLSMKRLCREECRGLCAVCGANRNLGECGCPPSPAHSPFAPLKEILDDEGSSGHGSSV
jgi:uncharacterized protein